MIADPFHPADALTEMAAGHAQGLQTLYRHEAPAMLALAHALVGSRVAEDLVRDTFILLWRHANADEAHRELARAWMYSILRHLARQYPTMTALPAPADDGLLYWAYCRNGNPGEISPALRVQIHTQLRNLLEEDLRIGEYVLATLPVAERESVEAEMARDPQAARCALQWEDRLLSLVDALPPARASAALLARIMSQLKLTMPAKPQPAPPAPESPAPKSPAPPPVSASKSAPAPKAQARRRTRVFLAGLALGLTLGGGAIGLAWWTTPAPIPIQTIALAPVRVAILQAPGLSSSPGWLVTVDSEGQLLMRPQVRTELPPGSVAQLWAHDGVPGAPRALGIIDPNARVSLPVSVLDGLGGMPYLEITQEVEQATPVETPEGPVLFNGRIVRFEP